jgi:CRISPR/Cas system endoribonuclease Cas6 (RAMP superfamily)
MYLNDNRSAVGRVTDPEAPEWRMIIVTCRDLDSVQFLGCIGHMFRAVYIALSKDDGIVICTLKHSCQRIRVIIKKEKKKNNHIDTASSIIIGISPTKSAVIQEAIVVIYDVLAFNRACWSQKFAF